jgi:hypothetical protein
MRKKKRKGAKMVELRGDVREKDGEREREDDCSD